MNTGLLLLIITISTALIFDFLNGFHDAANSIATVVSTRVLSPKLAVVWAAFFNFVAAFVLGTAVAKTIGKGMIRLDDVTQYVVIAGLLGAIVWDLLTWWWGLPTSSSHALIGGYAGVGSANPDSKTVLKDCSFEGFDGFEVITKIDYNERGAKITEYQPWASGSAVD